MTDFAERPALPRMAEDAACLAETTPQGKAMMEAIAREFLSIAELMDKLAAQEE